MVMSMRKIIKFLLIVFMLFGFSYYISNRIARKIEFYKDVSAIIGRRIIIDPGHGGKDNGACRDEVMEDEINLHISSYLYEYCVDELAGVYMTRTGDYDLASLYAPNRKQEDLRKRVEMINNFDADIFVSIHINAINNESVHGPMVYYRKNDDDSKRLASNISKQLNDLTKLDKSIHEEDYYLFKNTNKIGVLVECGFISNSKERANLIEPTYQQKLAKAIYDGMVSYFEKIKI